MKWIGGLGSTQHVRQRRTMPCIMPVHLHCLLRALHGLTELTWCVPCTLCRALLSGRGQHMAALLVNIVLGCTSSANFGGALEQLTQASQVLAADPARMVSLQSIEMALGGSIAAAKEPYLSTSTVQLWGGEVQAGQGSGKAEASTSPLLLLQDLLNQQQHVQGLSELVLVLQNCTRQYK